MCICWAYKQFTLGLNSFSPTFSLLFRRQFVQSDTIVQLFFKVKLIFYYKWDSNFFFFVSPVYQHFWKGFKRHRKESTGAQVSAQIAGAVILYGIISSTSFVWRRVLYCNINCQNALIVVTLFQPYCKC